MNISVNNFYILQPYTRKTTDVADAIYKYDNTIDVEVWRGNTELLLAKVLTAEITDWVGSITGNAYTEGELVLYDPTKVIKHFSDGTKLVRDDAITCLFNEDDNAPGANKNEIVIKIERNISLDMQNIINGFYGTVMDIQLADYWHEKSNVHNIKVGDKVILVNPYRAEDGYDVFTKISTTSGFYVVAEADAIACKLDTEKE